METATIQTSWLQVIAVSGAIAVMLIGVCLVFDRLKELKQGFGPNSLKALGVVLFLPILLLLAILTNFKTETLAALLGTVAGYVLSNTEDKTKPKNNSDRDNLNTSSTRKQKQTGFGEPDL